MQSFRTIQIATATPPIARRVEKICICIISLVDQYRQVFWLWHPHSLYLPIPHFHHTSGRCAICGTVAYQKSSSITAAGPRGNCTHFPFHQQSMSLYQTYTEDEIVRLKNLQPIYSY